jgi:KDO transferase-3
MALFAILRSFQVSDIRCRVCIMENPAERAMLPEPSPIELEQRRSASVHVLDGARKLGFSFDPEQGFFDADTVAYSALQVLAAAGASAVYFHGMDLSAPGPRFYESAGDVCTSNLSKNYRKHIEPSFAYASELRRQKGIELYNLSPTSTLPDAIITKVSWQLLARDPTGLHAKAVRVRVSEDSVDPGIAAVPAFVAA